MKKVLSASFFAPRSGNEEDRELEGVSNVMELYAVLTIFRLFSKI